MKKLFYLSFSLLFFITCNNPIAVTPGTQVNNIVTGIYITRESSEVIAVWGNPSSASTKSKSQDEEEEDSPASFGLSVPYPNPFISSKSIAFKIPNSSNVSLWLETAYLPDSESATPFQNVDPRKFQRIPVFENRKMTAGSHTVSTFGTDLYSECLGGNLEVGFYRVFIQAGSFLSWQDIYVAGVEIQAPSGLRDYISNNCTILKN